MEATIPKKRWRPRLRFSLRTMMIVMTVLSVYFAHRVEHAREQRGAVAALERAGALVIYDWGGPNWNALVDMKAGPAPPGPAWLRQLIGNEYFQEVVDVTWNVGVHTDAAEFANLARLPRLQRLTMQGELKDFRGERLAGLNDLEELTLSGLRNGRYSDATLQRIGQLSKLRWLSLAKSEITAAGIRHLVGLQNLEYLDLSRTYTNDAAMAPIGCLLALKELNLDFTDITDAGVAHLRPLQQLECFSAVGDYGEFQHKRFGPATVSLGDKALRLLARHPKLTDLSLGSRNHAPPRITGSGLAALRALPLKSLTLYNADLQSADFKLFNKFKTLTMVTVDSDCFSKAELAALRQQLPAVTFIALAPTVVPKSSLLFWNL